MNDSDLYFYWYVGLGITALVVVIVAVLLIWILVLARRIAANAGRALAAAEEIRTNTLPIWQLQATNVVGTQLLDSAQSIKKHAVLAADILEAGHQKRAKTA